MARAVLAPVAIAVLMGGRRDSALVAANIADRIRVIGVDVCGLVLDAFFPIRAISIRAFVPVARAVLAPITIAVLMGGRCDGALVAANIADRIRVIVIDVRGLVRDALVPIRAVSIRAFVPVARAVLAPVAVGVRMLRAEAPIGADVAEFILIVIIDVGRAVHFFAPIRAVFGGADAIVPFGIIAPAVKGVRMAEFGGANITAVVAVWIRVIIIAVGGFVLDAAGLIRAVCIGTLVPVAVYVPAPIAVDMTAGMVRGSGTLVFADIAGGVRVVVIDVGIPVDDPAVLLRAVRIGAFAPMLPAVPAPLAIEMGMSRGDGTVVAADAANVAAVGVAGLPGLGLAAGFGAGLPVFGTVIVPFPVGVLGMPVAADGAVAVAVEGMGRFVLLRAGSVCADRVGTLAPVAGLIPTVKAFRVGVAADGAGIAAGDAFRAGLAVVNMLGIVGNKFAIA